MDDGDQPSRAERLSQVDRSASRTRGIITPAVRAAAGLTEGQVRWRMASQRWEPLRRGVPAVVGSPRTWEQLLQATVEAAGGDVVVSHGTLARLLGYGVGALDDVIEVTGPAGRLVRLEGVVGHRTRHLDERDRREWFGIRATTAERMVCDLSSRVAEHDLDRFVDQLQRDKRLRLPRLAAAVGRLGRAPGRSPSVVHRILAARFAGYEPGDSHFEARVLRVIEAAALPLPTLGHWVETNGNRYKLDMAYPHWRLYVEADGWEDHGTRSAFDRDRRRLNALVIAGWTPTHLTWRMSDDEIASTISAALCSRDSRRSSDGK
jgi:hypothetical protein